METPVQLAARLLAALTELIEQEGMYLRGGSFELAAQIRTRAHPVVHQLVNLAGSPGVGDFRPQVLALVEHSARHSVLFQERMNELSTEIQRNDQARRRAAQVAPAYVHSLPDVAPRFLAAG